MKKCNAFHLLIKLLLAVCPLFSLPSVLSAQVTSIDQQALYADLQAAWEFKVLTNNITPAKIGEDLLVQNAALADDRWFGPVVEFKDPGGSFTIDEAYIDTQSNHGNLSFWIQTPRAGNDATWQDLLTIHPSRNWTEQVTVRLRWNRFVVKKGGALLLETSNERRLVRDQWHHVSINFSPDLVEIFLDGLSFGEASLPEGVFDIDEELRFGGDGLLCRLLKVNVFSTVLSNQEILDLIESETPPRPDGWNDPAPNIARFSIGEIAESKGYMVEEINQFFPEIQKWKDFDARLDPLKKASGYASDRFTSPPAPYEHPRIFFNASDLESIRNEIANSHLRKQKWEMIRSRCFQIRSTPEEWEAMGSLGSPVVRGVHPDNPEWAVIRLPRMGYHGPWVGGWVNDLANGIDPPELSGKWNLPVNNENNPRQFLMHLMPYEALRCLLDNDIAGGQRIGKALATICTLYGQHMEQWQATDNWQDIYQILGSDSIGVTYDWAYPFMTEADRATVRNFISEITKDKISIGFDHLPAYPGTTSNWSTIHMHLINLILAIEGEEGFHEDVYQGCVEVMRKWCYVATGPNGAAFEGYNKSSYATHHLLPLARREADFLSTEWVKNAGSKYHLATMLPWGTEHIYELESGPNVLPRDFAPFKYAYPEDPIVDIVYGNIVKDQFGSAPTLEWDNTRTSYSPVFPYFLYYDDPIGTTPGGDYDFQSRADVVVDELATSELPTFYYSDYRGLLSTRTSWEKDAAFLLFEPRNVPGGHTLDARNDFVIASHGRLWNQRPAGVNGEGPSSIRNIILIDGIGQGHQCVQGRTVSLVDSQDATIATGDATWAYSFRSGDPATGIKVEHTPNDSRLMESELPWMDQPWSFLPGWRYGKFGASRHGYWFEHNPIEYSYRTVALVKNEKPYWIIRDDLKKDDSPHDYNWHFQVPDDLAVIEPAHVKDGGIDLILGDQENRRLLVRILEIGSGHFATAAMAATIDVKPYVFTDHNGKQFPHQRLEIPVTDTVGNFTVLLFPFLQGEALPTTTLEDETLTNQTGTHVDTFSLTRATNGMTMLELVGGVPLPLMDYRLDESPDAANVIDSAGNTTAIINSSTDPLPVLVTSGAPQGNAWDFSGTSRRIQVANNASVASIGNASTTDGMTIASWLKLDNSSNAYGFRRFCGLNNVVDGYVYADRAHWVLYDGSSWWTVTGTPSGGNTSNHGIDAVCDGMWHHVTITVDFTQATNNVKLYRDGVLQLTGSHDMSNAPGAGTSTFFIGARLNGGSAWPGMMDQFQVWTQALTASDVLDVSNAPNPPSNQVPTCSLTAPVNGATYTAPASVTIQATATDTDGTITKVEFFNGSTLLGTDTSAPYSYTWNNVAAGTYSLTAKATDNVGALKVSAAVGITVQSASGGVPIPLNQFSNLPG